MANLKTEVDKLDVHKLAKLDVDDLKPVPTDLSKLSNLVKNYAVKMTEFDELIKKVDAIVTSKLIKKQIIITKSGMLKVKYLVLLAQLVLLLLLM